MNPMQPLVRRGHRCLSRNTIAATATVLSQAMAGSGAVLNLCEDRQHFLTGLLATLMAHRETVLPPSAAPQVVADLEQRLSIELILDDAWVQRHVPATPAPTSAAVIPGEDTDGGVTLFTSGSTGAPTPHARTWQQLVRGARLLNTMLGLDHAPPHHLLATTPCQHMYGLEAGVMLPLIGGHTIDARRPLLPGDVRSVLTELPSPRALITTPLHLRMCLEADDADWPEVALLLSATAPLEQDLAERAERRFNGILREIYGSTETGALALRQPVREQSWTPVPGAQVQRAEDRWKAKGTHFPACDLADHLEVFDDGRFILTGRDADLIKIAGKRTSLSGLNQMLVSLPGVIDAVVLPPAAAADDGRLRALVVAPDRSTEELRRMLRAHIDPAFVPRPIIQVDALPRNERGKLTADALTHLLEQLGISP